MDDGVPAPPASVQDVVADEAGAGSPQVSFSARSLGRRALERTTARSAAAEAAEAKSQPAKLGTFKGVFVPTMQNILGIILFLRVPFIVGQAGILQALAIVYISCLTTLLTSISMSAVATNGVPKGGGCYSIIKNSLGAQFGGVTGLLLFLSNTFGVALYVLGCVEVLRDCFPAVFLDVPVKVLGLAVLGALGAVVYIGVEYFSKVSVLFLAGVVAAIVSTWMGVVYNASPEGGKENQGVVGFSYDTLRANWGPRYMNSQGQDWSFAECLAVFYPAVTDPLAGSNLSGDLADPQKSIPPGTIWAVLCTILVFTIQVVFVAGGSCQRWALRDDYFIVANIAWPVREIICVGVLLSTLGAGLQSLAGAPRLLAALGRDNLIPSLSRFAPPEGEEPRAALILCVVLSAGIVLIGDLNLVAPFITLWFLTCYTIINFACAWLAYERTPSFRPSFKYFDWRVSVFGVVLNLVLMFYIAPYYAIGALALAACLYKYIERQTVGGTPGGDVDYGELELANPDDAAGRQESGLDWRSGLRFNQARNAMLSLEERDLQFKYWRPFVLFLCKLDQTQGGYVPQAGMIHFLAQLMKRGRGLALVNGVMVSDEGVTERAVSKADRARRALRATLRERGVEGFADVVVAESVVQGQKLLIQAKGIGFFRPNTVMVGWPPAHLPDFVHPSADRDAAAFTSLIEDTSAVGKSVVICHGGADFPKAGDKLRGRIDVWWVFDLFPAAGLLLLLPFLLMKDKVWGSCILRLVVVSARGEDAHGDDLDEAVKAMLKAGGVIVDVVVLRVSRQDAPRFKASPMHKESKRDVAYQEMNISEYIRPENRHLDGSEHGGLPPSPTPTQDPLRPSRLTALIQDHSGDSELVVISLPPRPTDMAADTWMASVDTLLTGLRRVVLVKESGREKVQFFQ
ncbi:amino acid permease-domain-containing protein [Pelagophyceae sp. CCMP2097]|nr:amino acid permease-domain-containing protein [Pelagophyceae sp. CCMP2097]|mmetsp:Transcript_6620/g.21394  ORF Transcript_6620/g.21394 Transcript_6620/m.21394 type:complete len:912 (-) Transcript_6620:91-2826(-)